jgi:O-Antigen ligase
MDHAELFHTHAVGTRGQVVSVDKVAGVEEVGSRENVRASIVPSGAVIGICIAAWLVLFVAAPGLSRYGFIGISFVCALYLFWKSEILYVSFVWWLYFLAPFLRRVVDNRAGFDSSSVMLAGPLFASAIACIELLKLWRADKRSLPFILAAAGVAYGLGVSLISGTSLPTAAQYFLGWLGPIAFGYLLYTRWQEYPGFRDGLQKTFKWGLLVMGVYALIQYVFAPVWDCFWMQNLPESISSFGTPEPLGIRAFSTMNAPQPFALALVLGLMITFYGRSSLVQKAAWVAGYIGLLLSMARSAWLELGLALVVLAFVGRSRKVLSTVLIAICLFAIVAVAATKLPLGQAVTDRFKSLNDVSEDGSGQERLAGYDLIVKTPFADPFGQGWRLEAGNSDSTRTDDSASAGGDAMPIHDSSVVEVRLCTGWFGLAMFYGSITAAIVLMFRNARTSDDKLIAITCTMLIVLLVETLFNSLLGGPNELGLWTCIGLGLAGCKHAEQSTIAPAHTAQADMAWANPGWASDL